MIEAQTGSVRAIIVQLQIAMADGVACLKQELRERLTAVKAEVVRALRQVVEVLDKYASYLPGDSRNKVRNFIMSLPNRWV